MHDERHARLFRSGDSQAVQIPREFEMPGDEVVMHKQGDRLIIEPLRKENRLAELLASWEPIEDDFPEVDDPPVKPEDIF
jgi:antitoxin VapB